MSRSNDVVVYDKISKHVALVTLNRPDARNAINEEMAIRLDDIVKRTEADADIRAVVLASSGGRAFCGGADLKEISLGRAAKLFTPDGGFAGFVDAPRTVPWIAAVDGFALAGGLEILLTCDIRVSSLKSEFGLPEVKRGLMALAGGIYRLPRALPRSVALEMIVTGDNLGAQRAWQIGLVNHLAEPDEVISRALSIAEAIAANAPIAVQQSLHIARIAMDYDEEELKRMSRQARDYLVTTDDYLEGPRAFIQKRPPMWKGH